MALWNIFTFLSLLILTISSRGDAELTPNESKRILEELIQTYDGSVRPEGAINNASAPTNVRVNFYVRSITGISAQDMTYETQLTFRMAWTDRRLRSNTYGQVTLPQEFIQKIWKPDLFFSNEKEGKKHDLLSPNEYVRVSLHNGDILYSARISLKLSCPMTLKDFPFETITCSLRMASYGYTKKDIIFTFNPDNPVQITSDLHLPSYSLEKYTTDYCDSITTTGSYSCLRADLIFRRESCPVLINVYVPMITSILLVWLSMWINPKESGVIRLIGLISASLLCKWAAYQLPDLKLSYFTNFDYWNFMCNGFILFALLEFVLVHIIGRGNLNAVHQGGNKVVNACSNQSISGKIDVVIRVLYPLAFGGCVVYYCLYYAKLH